MKSNSLLLSKKNWFIGSIIVGDMNCHEKAWLRFSVGSSPEGRLLRSICGKHSLEECVRAPTRGANLLDLFLTDMPGATNTKVHASVNDHFMVLGYLDFPITGSRFQPRECFMYKEARWKHLNVAFGRIKWKDVFAGCSPDDAVNMFLKIVLSTVKEYIPYKVVRTFKSTHPWLNEICANLVVKKRAAFGTFEYGLRQQECSEGIRQEYLKFVAPTKEKLSSLPRESKAWWKLSKNLSMQTSPCIPIPPLKQKDGTWAISPYDKANLFAETFLEKSTLPDVEINEYSGIVGQTTEIMSGFLPIRQRHAEKILSHFDPSSATGCVYLREF